MSDGIDIRHLPYMPLHIERLRKSKSWLRCKRRPELAFYLLNLWMRAWHEVPAGSIESDDDVLADAAMCDPSKWDEVKADLLNGWVERDGRIFHPVLEELVAEAAQKLRGNQNRTKAAREAALAAKRQSGDASVTEAATDSVTGDEGKGREGKNSNSNEFEDRAPPEKISREAKPPPTTILRSVLDEKRAAALVDHRKKLRVPLTDHAAQLLADKLARFADPNAAADMMMVKGWQSIEPNWDGVPPLKPAPVTASVQSLRAWIRDDDPRWRPLAERYERETGRRCSADGGRNDPGIGRHFPNEWLDDLKAQENAA